MLTFSLFLFLSFNSINILIAIQCPELVLPPNAYFSGRCNSYIGCTCRINYYPNYQLIGSGVRTCLRSGLWSGVPTQCLSKQNSVNCQPITQLANGYIINTCDQKFMSGCSLTFKCNPGFRIEGSNTIYCMGNGLWSESKPQCFKACGISSIEGSFEWFLAEPVLKYLLRGIPGMKCILVCKKGYRPVGHTFTICNEITYKWSQPIPYCVPQYLEI